MSAGTVEDLKDAQNMLIHSVPFPFKYMEEHVFFSLSNPKYWMVESWFLPS